MLPYLSSAAIFIGFAAARSYFHPLGVDLALIPLRIGARRKCESPILGKYFRPVFNELVRGGRRERKTRLLD
jgi:hypothetical protein